MFCTGCGKELDEGARFCKACGMPREVAPPQQQLQPQPGVPGALPPAGLAAGPYAPAYMQGPIPVYRKKNMKPLILALTGLILAGAIVGGIFIYLKASEPSRKLSQARATYNQKDYTRSIELCDEVISKWPNKPQAAEAATLRQDASLHHAEDLVAEGDLDSYEEAEGIFDDLVDADYSDTKSLDKDRVKLYLSWAGDLKQTYSYEDAVNKYEMAAAIEPLGTDDQSSKVECLFQLGEQLKGAGNYGDAAAAYKKCNDEDNQGPLADAAWTNYIDMTVSAHVDAPPPSKEAAAAGSAEVTIKNNTNEDVIYYLSGPTSASYDVPALQSLTIHVTPGYYNEISFSDSSWFFPQVNYDYTSPISTGWYYTATINYIQ